MRCCYSLLPCLRSFAFGEWSCLNCGSVALNLCQHTLSRVLDKTFLTVSKRLAGYKISHSSSFCSTWLHFRHLNLCPSLKSRASSVPKLVFFLNLDAAGEASARGAWISLLEVNAVSCPAALLVSFSTAQCK